MTKTALIIGISGQDGAYLAELLLEMGYEVVGTSRDHEVGSFKNLDILGIRKSVKLCSMSLVDFRSVMTVLDSVSPHEIYNLAGQTSVGLSFLYPVETFESIAVGVINILECIRMRKRAVKFYNASSSEIFGNTPVPANEETAFRPRSPYATAKAAAHGAVANYREAYGLFASSGILFNHESPLRPSRFVTRKIVQSAVEIFRGRKARLSLGNMDVWRDWGWAPDYVDAMWRILQHEAPEDFIVATGKSHSLRQFVEAVFSELGMDWREYVDSDPDLFRPSDLQHSTGSAEKAGRLLGWKAAHGFNEIIRRLVQAELNCQKHL